MKFRATARIKKGGTMLSRQSLEQILDLMKNVTINVMGGDADGAWLKWTQLRDEVRSELNAAIKREIEEAKKLQ
jgi:hypothetical protein